MDIDGGIEDIATSFNIVHNLNLVSIEIADKYVSVFSAQTPPPSNIYNPHSLLRFNSLSFSFPPSRFMAPANNNGQIENSDHPSKFKVTIVGSGNWGSVASKLIASNTLKLPSFHDEVKMWVFEETLPSGEKLTDVINSTNENVKYLPGIKLGHNVLADPDLENAVGGRNRKCAEAFAKNGGKRFVSMTSNYAPMKGVSTAKEVYEVLKHKGWLEMFPLFTTVHEICTGRLPPSAIVEYSEHTPKLPLVGGHAAFQ